MDTSSLHAKQANSLSLMVPIIYHAGWEIKEQPWSHPLLSDKKAMPYIKYDSCLKLYMRTIPYHWMMMVIEGDVNIYVDGTKHLIQKNMLFHMPPNKEHHFHIEKATKYIWIHYKLFAPALTDHILPPTSNEEEFLFSGHVSLKETEVALPLLLKLQNHRLIRQVMITAIEEFVLEEPGYLLSSRANLQFLLTLLFRELMQMEGGSHSVGISDPFIAAAVEHIHQFFAAKLSISSLASLANLSPNYFITRFGEMTGFSPGEYMIRVRISQAKKLIKTTDYNFTQIALLVGFESLSYFSRSFHKLEGISPRGFKQRLPRG